MMPVTFRDYILAKNKCSYCNIIFCITLEENGNIHSKPFLVHPLSVTECKLLEGTDKSGLTSLSAQGLPCRRCYSLLCLYKGSIYVHVNQLLSWICSFLLILLFFIKLPLLDLTTSPLYFSFFMVVLEYMQQFKGT